MDIFCTKKIQRFSLGKLSGDLVLSINAKDLQMILRRVVILDTKCLYPSTAVSISVYLFIRMTVPGFTLTDQQYPVHKSDPH